MLPSRTKQLSERQAYDISYKLESIYNFLVPKRTAYKQILLEDEVATTTVVNLLDAMSIGTGLYNNMLGNTLNITSMDVSWLMYQGPRVVANLSTIGIVRMVILQWMGKDIPTLDNLWNTVVPGNYTRGFVNFENRNIIRTIFDSKPITTEAETRNLLNVDIKRIGGCGFEKVEPVVFDGTLSPTITKGAIMLLLFSTKDVMQTPITQYVSTKINYTN